MAKDTSSESHNLSFRKLNKHNNLLSVQTCSFKIGGIVARMQDAPEKRKKKKEEEEKKANSSSV